MPQAIDDGAEELPRRRGRGPDINPRELQPRVVERAAGEAIPDWSSFDISRSLRTLRTGTSAQVERELRKLHLRWWHASRVHMERILRCASVPAAVYERVAGIVQTCRECRAWASTGPDPTPTVELTTAQNEIVEGDLIFYRQYIAWHMMDRADRWHAGVQVEDKHMNTLLEALTVAWISIFGPFKILVVDGAVSYTHLTLPTNREV